MAEQLGQAVLTVSADTRQLEAGLQRAQQQAQAAGQATAQAFTKSGQALQTAANGLQYYVDAQGRARDASGRFVTSLELQAAGLQKLGGSAAGAAAGVLGVGAASGRAVVGVQALNAALTAIAAKLAIFETIRRIVFFGGDQITQFDKASAAVRTLGVDSEKLEQRLAGLSLKLGNSASQVELIKAAYDVASSGFADAASASKILEASALGAQGGFTQLDDVVRAVTGVLNAYGLSADQATKVVDQFLQTQNDGVITVRQYAAEIGNIASIAAAGGVGLDQLNAAVATATLRGVPVAQTFTGLRQALSSIIKPSQQAAELAASLGLQFNVSALQSKGLAGVLADVQRATGGSADKIAILLGSVEAQAAVQPLLNDKLAKYNELVGKQANANGAAAEAAKINTNTISGQLVQIGNGFKNLATNLDSVLSPVFKLLLDRLNALLLGLNRAALFNPKRVNQAIGEANNLLGGLQAGRGPQTFTFQGKTYRGSIVEIRRALVRDLVLGEVGNAQTAPAPARAPGGTPPPGGGGAGGGAVISPAQANFIQQTAALELRGLQEKLAVTRQLAGLNEAERTRLQNRLTLNDKIRAVQQTRLQLDQELAKPKGSTGSPTEQDPAKLLDLQNKVTAGQVEVATLRLQNQQADAAALRTQQERIRGQELERANAQAKLGITQQQTQLERQALAAGVEVSRTAQLRLQQEEQIASVVRQQQAAQKALQAERSKPKAQQDRVALDGLEDRLRKANADVRQAYADAGLALVQNARNAASELKSAQQSFNSIARGGFQYLTPIEQRRQLMQARASVQRGVDSGQIRSGIDTSTPEKLFAVANFAEQIVPAQERLTKAIDENRQATAALAGKDWQVYVSVPGQQTFVPLSNT